MLKDKKYLNKKNTNVWETDKSHLERKTEIVTEELNLEKERSEAAEAVFTKERRLNNCYRRVEMSKTMKNKWKKRRKLFKESEN